MLINGWVLGLDKDFVDVVCDTLRANPALLLEQGRDNRYPLVTSAKTPHEEGELVHFVRNLEGVRWMKPVRAL